MNDQEHNKDHDIIELSEFTHQLIQYYKYAWYYSKKYGGDFVEVSDAASFFALIYERIRNSVEFGEQHIIRRSAIIRILKRRLSGNVYGVGQGINILKELLWGKYLQKASVTKDDAAELEQIIQKFYIIKQTIIKRHKIKNKKSLNNFFYDLLACEIDEFLNRQRTEKILSQLYYIFHTTKNKVQILNTDKNLQDQYFFVACNAAYLKNDPIYIRYHLFVLKFNKFRDLDKNQIHFIITHFNSVFKSFDKIINNPYQLRLSKFISKLLPPYYILFAMFEKYQENTINFFQNKAELSSKITEVSNEKYRTTGKKLRMLGIRSIIYIFITKMVFIILLEIPISIYILKQFHITPLAINGLIPPVMMALIVGITFVPSDANTKLLYNRIIDVVNSDPSYENKVLLTISPKKSSRVSISGTIFTIFYATIFSMVFIFIYAILEILHFNLISKLIFMFFISVVTFFGYRIRQLSKQYSLEQKDGFLSHFADLFLLPILSVGKVLSNQLSRINLFMIFFDLLLDAPLKTFVEVFEAWIGFARKRKEEIV